MDEIEKSVLNLFEHDMSIKAISKKLQISECKVQKILCNHGISASSRAAQVMRLCQAGKSPEEIACILEISKNAVQRYTPYTKGLQNADCPTKNAIRIRNCRAKKKLNEESPA